MKDRMCGSMAKDLPITEFDMLTLNESTQMFKAMIPFLDYNLQKTLSILIRINELQQTLHFYNDPCNQYSFSSCNCNNPISAASSFTDLLSNDQLIQTILKYCPESYASLLQNFLQFSKMADLFNIMNGNNIQPSTDDFSSVLQNAAGMFSGFNPFSAASPPESSNPGSNSDNQSGSNPDSNVNSNPQKASIPKSSPDSQGMLKSFMNSEQQKMYDDFLHKLDNVDFNCDT